MAIDEQGQYMLELTNRMRADPVGEYDRIVNADAAITAAISFFGVNLTTLRTQFNALTAVPPLAWNDTLGGTAVAHNTKMQATGEFSHQCTGEAAVGTRITTAGYAWSAIGENISYSYNTFDSHAAYAIDWAANPPSGIASPPDHRDNIMSATFRDLGIGVVSGGAAPSSPTTQDFGMTSAAYGNPYVVGVVFRDRNSDGLYSLTSGMNGATVDFGGGHTATTNAWGGYQLRLAAGTYTATASGGGLGSSITHTVTVGADNVRQNFVSDYVAAGSFSFTGAAVGKAAFGGVGAGAFSFSGGSLTGKPLASGTAAGTFSFSGAAAAGIGSAAAGSFSFTGAAATSSTVAGTAAGSFAFTGAAVGGRLVTGSATGTFSFAGAVTTLSPSAAAGAFSFTGDAVGSWIVSTQGYEPGRGDESQRPGDARRDETGSYAYRGSESQASSSRRDDESTSRLPRRDEG